MKKTITINYKIIDKVQEQLAIKLLSDIMDIYKTQIEQNKKGNKLEITIK